MEILLLNSKQEFKAFTDFYLGIRYPPKKYPCIMVYIRGFDSLCGDTVDDYEFIYLKDFKATKKKETPSEQ